MFWSMPAWALSHAALACFSSASLKTLACIEAPAAWDSSSLNLPATATELAGWIFMVMPLKAFWMTTRPKPLTAVSAKVSNSIVPKPTKRRLRIRRRLSMAGGLRGNQEDRSGMQAEGGDHLGQLRGLV